MSKALRHAPPVHRDEEILTEESRMQDQGNELRTWYAEWNAAWDLAVRAGWLTPSGSPLWRESTRTARRMCLRPDQLLDARVVKGLRRNAA